MDELDRDTVRVVDVEAAASGDGKLDHGRRVVSADGDDLLATCDGALRKPFEPEVLEEEVRSLAVPPPEAPKRPAAVR